MPRNTFRQSPRPIADARDAAYRHLSAQARRLPDLIPSEINVGTLDARDASLAHAIVDASITRWRTLEFIIESLSGKLCSEFEPRMRAVLLGGSAQLLLLDRVPPHAVLDESVTWAKRNIRPGAGGMVNAILRKVARCKGEIGDGWDHHIDAIPLSDGKSLNLNGVELPNHGRRRLAIACSLTNAVVQRWESQFGDPTKQALHTLYKPPTLLYVAHSDDNESVNSFPLHESGVHRMFRGSRQELLALLESNPRIWVQDPASSATLGELELPEIPKNITDLCAGQGTKTRQIRALFPDSMILACDVDPKRLSTLKEVFQDDRALRVAHAERINSEADGTMDFVLADVPCSNSGVFARRREARYRPIGPLIDRLEQLQREIIERGVALLRPGGHLLYATCSLEEEENECVCQWAEKTMDLEVIRTHRVMPEGQPGSDPLSYSDGAFSALMKKP